ncbi:MAG: hypothetical protein JSV43_01865 [Methanobacteriota archaeon]|nr:MAG: hypothetical protein JSV43_01865 [Euryarchaeota archaeon]
MSEKKEAESGRGPERKDVEDLSATEIAVYGVLTPEGFTLERIRREVGDRADYTEILDALKVLLDNELVSVTTHGRHTIYKRVEEY